VEGPKEQVEISWPEQNAMGCFSGWENPQGFLSLEEEELDDFSEDEGA